MKTVVSGRERPAMAKFAPLGKGGGIKCDSPSPLAKLNRYAIQTVDK